MPDRPDFITMNEERLMEYGNAVLAAPPFEAGTPEVRQLVYLENHD